MTHEIFISYSRQDMVLVHSLAEQIYKALGVVCWIVPNGIEGREDFEHVIKKAIYECKVVLFMLSDSSLSSTWTKLEVLYAERYGKRIVPVLVQGDVPVLVQGDGLRGWFQLHFGNIDYIDIRSEEDKEKLIWNLRDWLEEEEEAKRKTGAAAELKAAREAKRQAEEKAKCKAEAEVEVIVNDEKLRRLREESTRWQKDCSSSWRSNCSSISIPKRKLARGFIYDTFSPTIKPQKTSITNIWKKIFCCKTYEVYSSVFAPAEVKRKSHMQVQVYIHLYKETEMVKALAQESDKNAERRDYIPLQCKLKKGDQVDVLLNIYGEDLLWSEKKSIVWAGSFNKCCFDCSEVLKDVAVEELGCVALLSVNGVPVGEMRFFTKIVEHPKHLNPEVIAHKYNKVFISYSHQDESKVKFLHEGLELGAVPHFFDRKYLKAGDVFPKVIQDYINTADLFILCWSENASKSDYVQKERMQALKRAFPQVKPEEAAKLRIYPMNIEPKAELPSDMKDYYHFGEL